MLTIQSGAPGTPLRSDKQLLHQIDLAGNIIRETNIGVLAAATARHGGNGHGTVRQDSQPPPVGAACLDDFDHDAIQTLPNGGTAVLVTIEKIYPPGTQGDPSGLPVDIIGDGIVILDRNWQVVWYWDAFQHAGGAPQLDINRPAVLTETCLTLNSLRAVPPLSLAGSGISPRRPIGCIATVSITGPRITPEEHPAISFCLRRNQDWLMKIDYNNGVQSGGLGTGNILWLMGADGAFTFANIDNDPYPWFSGQHEVDLENNGAGPLTLFDNGNTRKSVLAGHCGPSDCNSRGMALTIDETHMTVTPVLSTDLGVFSYGDGSAQMLSDGNYYFFAGSAPLDGAPNSGYSIEIFPTPGTVLGTLVLNMQGPTGYRGWQLPSLYVPPTS